MVIAGMFTAAIIHYSYDYGRMLVGPTYDDVVYLNEGLLYLQIAHTEGMWALIEHAVQHPPHSPFATGIAFASFLIFGATQWAPYAGMGLGVLAVMLVADRLLVGLPGHARIAAAVFAVTFPIVGTLPEQFRPDATAGLVTAFGVLMMLRYSPFWAPRAHQYWTGLCFAMALLIKTPVFPFTLCMFMGSWMLSILAGARTDIIPSGERVMPALLGKERGYWAAIWPYWAPLLVLAGPLYVLTGRTVLRYIYENVLGQNQKIWQLQRPLPSLARFIWDGEAGQLMLGHHGYLVIGLAGLAALIYMARGGTGVIVERARVALAIAGALFLAWLFPTVSRYGNPFIGSTFTAILLFVGILLLRSLFLVDACTTGSKVRVLRHGTIIGWGAVILAVLAFQWPPRLGDRNSEWVIVDNRVERAVYRALVDHSAGRQATVFVTSAAHLSSHLLEFRARVDQAPLTVLGPPYSSNIQDYRLLIAASDYVVSGDQGAFRENTRLPYYGLQNVLLTELKADTRFALLTMVPTYGGLNIYVFGRKPP
jgi:hypothetical protein